MNTDALVLRDIHMPPAPSWWPPAPGWWLVAALVIAVLVITVAWRARESRRKRRIAQWFDCQLDAAATPTAQVAAMSELLRRAGRRQDPLADRLEGEDWLTFLDDAPRVAGRSRRKRVVPASRPFSEGAGRLLLDGAYRREVDGAQVEALRRLARERFLKWMGAW